MQKYFLAESILPNCVLKTMVVDYEAIFCVHQSCDASKCRVKKDSSFTKRLLEKLVTNRKKLKILVTCGTHKQEPVMEKIRLPENSRSQFVEAYENIKDRKRKKILDTMKYICKKFFLYHFSSLIYCPTVFVLGL